MNGNPTDQSEALQRWMERTSDGLILFDRSGRCEDADERACEIVGKHRAELVGRAAGVLLPPVSDVQGDAVACVVRRDDGKEVVVEVRVGVRPGGGWAVVVRDGRAPMLARRREARRLRALTALSEASAAVLHAADESRMLEELCAVIVQTCGYRMAWVGLAQSDEEKHVRVAASAGREDGYLATADIRWSDADRGRGPTGECIRTGKASVARRIEEEDRFAPWRGDATQRGYL